jgi:hypothetical protein
MIVRRVDAFHGQPQHVAYTSALHHGFLQRGNFLQRG